jgi:hypothetical protein
VVGRRALLLGGGAALVAAGCGKDEVVGPPPATQNERIRLRALDRARRLASAVSAAGGGPHDVRAPDTAPDASAAPKRAQAALEAHVSALPSLTGSDRALGTDLVAASAADAALLGAPGTGSAFPGTPA